MKNFKGIIYAALSSSTFGLAPLFSILLLSDGFSSFEVLSYRWGVASLTLGIIGLAGGCRFRISRQELCTVVFLSLFRAATSLSMVIAYQNISSGVASIIHFMYPLAVALAMALFFRERISWRTAAAIGVSLAGVALLSTGGIGSRGGDTTAGTIALTAVAVGATVFGERFGWTSALGVGLVVAAVSIVVLDTQRKTWKTTPSSST